MRYTTFTTHQHDANTHFAKCQNLLDRLDRFDEMQRALTQATCIVEQSMSKLRRCVCHIAGRTHRIAPIRRQRIPSIAEVAERAAAVLDASCARAAAHRLTRTSSANPYPRVCRRCPTWRSSGTRYPVHLSEWNMTPQYPSHSRWWPKWSPASGWKEATLRTAPLLSTSTEQRHKWRLRSWLWGRSCCWSGWWGMWGE